MLVYQRVNSVVIVLWILILYPCFHAKKTVDTSNVPIKSLGQGAQFMGIVKH